MELTKKTKRILEKIGYGTVVILLISGIMHYSATSTKLNTNVKNLEKEVLELKQITKESDDEQKEILKNNNYQAIKNDKNIQIITNDINKIIIPTLNSLRLENQIEISIAP